MPCVQYGTSHHSTGSVGLDARGSRGRDGLAIPIRALNGTATRLRRDRMRSCQCTAVDYACCFITLPCTSRPMPACCLRTGWCDQAVTLVCPSRHHTLWSRRRPIGCDGTTPSWVLNYCTIGTKAHRSSKLVRLPAITQHRTAPHRGTLFRLAPPEGYIEDRLWARILWIQFERPAFKGMILELADPPERILATLACLANRRTEFGQTGPKS